MHRINLIVCSVHAIKCAIYVNFNGTVWYVLWSDVSYMILHTRLPLQTFLMRHRMDWENLGRNLAVRVLAVTLNKAHRQTFHFALA